MWQSCWKAAVITHSYEVLSLTVYTLKVLKYFLYMNIFLKKKHMYSFLF